MRGILCVRVCVVRMSGIYSRLFVTKFLRCKSSAEEGRHPVHRKVHRARVCVVRISGTYSCLFLIKSLRCKVHRARGGEGAL